jgi:ubiquinone/menaquinone biosynthesis C-methylase UbiE
MASFETFAQFERAGWADEAVALSYHQSLSEVTRACVPALLESARLKPSDRVLDIACGVGYVTAAARDCGARAVGIDFSAAQVRLAEQTYPDIKFLEADAEALPFGDRNFDVVFNAFGMPHLPNPDVATAEAHRVLTPGGRFVYASWAEPAKCIGLAMFYDAIRSHGTLDVGLPQGPNFFACGEPDVAKEMLGGAGFRDITTTEVALVWRVSSPDTIIDTISSGTVRTAAVLSRQSPESLMNIKKVLRERISAFRQNGTYAVPAPALVVVGVH